MFIYEQQEFDLFAESAEEFSAEVEVAALVGAQMGVEIAVESLESPAATPSGMAMVEGGSNQKLEGGSQGIGGISPSTPEPSVTVAGRPPTRIGVSILGSGSRGNAILVHTDNRGVLFDAGFSRKDLLRRLAELRIEPSVITALVLSHEHGDHTRGARVLADALGVPTYCTREACAYLRARSRLGGKVVLFNPGDEFTLDPFTIHPFSVPHDALNPVGFMVTTGRIRIGIATDLGHINKLAMQRLRGCHALMLETNHDTEMLRASERRLMLKRRILGRQGHLNNDDALESLAELLTDDSQVLALTHISDECNCPEMLGKMARTRLAEIGRLATRLIIAAQDQPTPTIWLPLL